MFKIVVLDKILGGWASNGFVEIFLDEISTSRSVPILEVTIPLPMLYGHLQ